MKEPLLPGLQDKLDVDLTDLTVNPHAVKEEELREYHKHHWPLVLKHGRLKFGLACMVGGTNGALNHINSVAARFGCGRALARPLEVLLGNFANLFEQMCVDHKWTREEIQALMEEIGRAEIQEGTPKILAADGTRTLN